MSPHSILGKIPPERPLFPFLHQFFVENSVIRPRQIKCSSRLLSTQHFQWTVRLVMTFIDFNVSLLTIPNNEGGVSHLIALKI